MPRPLPIPNPLLKETTKVLQRIVPVSRCPRGLKPLDLNVVRVQEFQVGRVAPRLAELISV
jgi:hypothetical protein